MATSPQKRKLLTDFFTPPAKTPKLTPQPSVITDLPVPGLSLHLNFITASEESSLLAHLHSRACTWRTDLSRRTMHFGGEYCLMPPKRSLEDSNTRRPPTAPCKPEIIQAPLIPQALAYLLHRMSARGIYAPSQPLPQYCIVNHYVSSQGISAHTENFAFSSPVVGLSLLSSCPMRFHELVTPDGGSVRSGKAQKARRTGRWVDVELPGRSLVVMDGESRWKWQHEIVRGGRGRGPGWERVSLTFRVKE